MAVQSNTRRFGLFPLKRSGVNPILIKELRSRMRGPRAFLVLTGFLVLLSIVAFLLYRTMEESLRYSGPVQMSASIGLVMFMGLAFFELVLVAFITPALTAGTISSERESLTYEMLMATPLPPASILFGKMIAALSYVFLLIFAAIPLLSVVVLFGGVTLRDMGVALLILLVTTLTFGTIGVFWSALLGRTGRATVMSYLTLFCFVFVPFVLYVFWGVLKHQTPPPAVLYINPFSALASIMQTSPESMGLYGMPFMFFSLLSGGVMGQGAVAYNHPAWHWSLAFYATLTVILTMLTILLVRPVGRRRVTHTQAMAAIAVLLVMGLGFAQVFNLADWYQIWESPDEAIQRQGMKGMILPNVSAVPPAARIDLP